MIIQRIRSRIQLVLWAVAAFTITIGTPSLSSASILPPNDLHLEDQVDVVANIDEQLFNKIIDDIMKIYEPFADAQKITLEAKKLWTNNTVNASAEQPRKDLWRINMYGGLARRKEVTPDGFALVVCHELGHHFGGFVFKGSRWASAEGQSDYYATQACGRIIWKNQLTENERFRASVDPEAKKQCDLAWKDKEDQDLCYRISMGGHSLAALLAALGRKPEPEFGSPDQNKVTVTNTRHPAAQCRLDTYFQGALCIENFDLKQIPGKNHPTGQESMDAEKEAIKYSCSATGAHSMGLRPTCWFKARY